MRNVVRNLRWVALPTAAFFLFALITGMAVPIATTALVVVGLAVVTVSVVDLATRRS
jgi:hypothetical protein